jgi:hypothetical protein
MVASLCFLADAPYTICPPQTAEGSDTGRGAFLSSRSLDKA